MKSVPIVREPLDRPHSKTVLTGVSKTEQAHKPACCINRLMNHYNRTGMLPVNPRGVQPQYGDVSGLNKPFDQLIRDRESTLSDLSAEQSAKRSSDRAARKAAKAAEFQAAVDKAVALKGSATT